MAKLKMTFIISYSTVNGNSLKFGWLMLQQLLEKWINHDSIHKTMCLQPDFSFLNAGNICVLFVKFYLLCHNLYYFLFLVDKPREYNKQTRSLGICGISSQRRCDNVLHESTRLPRREVKVISCCVYISLVQLIK